MSDTITKTFTSLPDALDRVHTFTYEVDELVNLHDWIVTNKTAEEYEFWKNNDHTENHTDIGAEFYAEWLVSQKVLHVITWPDGTVFTNDYKDYL